LAPDSVFLSVGRVGAAAELVAQHFIQCDSGNQKLPHLLNLLKEIKGQTLIFCEQKTTAEMVRFQLEQEGVRSESIHGDKPQGGRNKALYDFNKSNVRCLVATNVAARGLDLPNISHVINFELPSNIDDYVHRIGRTGRAGKSGRSTTFVGSSANAQVLGELIGILKEAKRDVPNWLHSVASQASSVGRSFQRRGPSSRPFGGSRRF